MMQENNEPPVQGYHPTTRWLHAGLVIGVLFQLTVAAWMQHPDHHAKLNTVVAVQYVEQTGSQHHDDLHQQQGHPVSASATAPTHDTHEKSALGALLMQAHRVGGVVVAVIVLLNLFWAIRRRGNPKNRQIAVLFSKQHWTEAWSLLRTLPWAILGKAPFVKPGNALALIVEMFGLLIMGVMAVTGTMIGWLWAGLGSDVSHTAELIMQLHGAAATFLIIYLVGHVSMALLHVYQGDIVFKRVSPFG